SHQDKGVNVVAGYGTSSVVLKKPVLDELVVLELKFQDQVLDSYAFKQKKWYINDLLNANNWKLDEKNFNPVEEICKAKGRYRVATRTEITNAALRIEGLFGKSSGNYFRRAIGEGLLAEWGKINVYTNAFWRAGYYWALETKDDGRHWAIRVNTGAALPLLTSSQAYTACISY